MPLVSLLLHHDLFLCFSICQLVSAAPHLSHSQCADLPLVYLFSTCQDVSVTSYILFVTCWPLSLTITACQDVSSTPCLSYFSACWLLPLALIRLWVLPLVHPIPHLLTFLALSLLTSMWVLSLHIMFTAWWPLSFSWSLLISMWVLPPCPFCWLLTSPSLSLLPSMWVLPFIGLVFCLLTFSSLSCSISAPACQRVSAILSFFLLSAYHSLVLYLLPS